MATGTAPGVRFEEGYAVVDPAIAATDFGGLAAALEALRDQPGMGVAILDLRQTLPHTYLQNEAAVLGRCVLPLVAAWGGSLAPASLAAGLWCDVRTISAGTTFATLEGLHAPTVERLVEVVAPGRDPERAKVDIRTLVQALSDASAGNAGPGSALLDAGLVSEIAAQGEALRAAEAVARMIASRGPLATQLAKEAVWRGLRMPFEQALRFETDLTLLLQTTKDRAEGVRAFVEKRPPRFRGE